MSRFPSFDTSIKPALSPYGQSVYSAVLKHAEEVSATHLREFREKLDESPFFYVMKANPSVESDECLGVAAVVGSIPSSDFSDAAKVAFFESAVSCCKAVGGATCFVTLMVGYMIVADRQDAESLQATGLRVRDMAGSREFMMHMFHLKVLGVPTAVLRAYPILRGDQPDAPIDGLGPVEEHVFSGDAASGRMFMPASLLEDIR